MTLNDEVIYRIDSNDKIEYANAEYDRFALANEGLDFTRDKVYDRPIWNYIGDETTREIYRELFRRVREGRTAQFQYRCDSPDFRRHLEMKLVRVGIDGIEFRTWPISIEKRPNQALLDVTLPRASAMLVICGWCKRVQIDGGWAEVEDAVKQLGLMESSKPPLLTHGICERCAEEMLRSTLGE